MCMKLVLTILSVTWFVSVVCPPSHLSFELLTVGLQMILGFRDVSDNGANTRLKCILCSPILGAHM